MKGVLLVIDDDIAEGWLEAWAAAGLVVLAAYLKRHDAFRRWLDNWTEPSTTGGTP